MTMSAIKSEIAALAPRQRREIMAYIVGLQFAEDESLVERMSRKIDNKDPKNWMSPEELDRRLGTLND